MTKIPKNWSTAKIGDTSQVIRGITFPASAKQNEYSPSNACCLRTTNIQKEVNWNDVYFVSQKYISHNEQFVDIGDILISMANSYELVGKVAVVRNLPYLSTFGAFISVIRPYHGLNRQYLFHILRTDRIQAELRKGSSQTVNIANISLKTLSRIDFPLAPLNEQKRIADKLDALLERVDGCREHLERVPGILKRFRQAVLAAATSGRLTEDDEIDQAEFQLLAQVLEHIKTGPFGSTLHKTDYIYDGVPLVNPMHINRGKIFPSTDMSISEEKAEELSEFRLARGDVVLGRRGVMGRCAVIGEKEEGWLCGSGSMLLHPNERVLPEYLQLFLSSPQTVKALEEDSVGSTMSNLNQKILLGLNIRVPDIKSQKKIVRRVEALFAYADRLEARYQAASERVEGLTPALLAKAFRGELVEQDPEDEPASVLLERIREEREQAAGGEGKRDGLERQSGKPGRENTNGEEKDGIGG